MVAAALAAATTVLAACSASPAPSGSGSGGSDGKLAPTTINIGVLPTANMAPLYLGQKQGYFKALGLTLNITTVAGGAAEIAGVQSGSFDFIDVGYVPLFAAYAHGLPVALLSGSDAGGSTKANDWQVVIAGKNSGIRTAKDLAGKTIGVNALNGVAEATVLASLQAQGVNEKSVKFVEVPFPQIPAAIDSGTIDAGFGTEPFVTKALDNGDRIVDNPSLTLGKNFPNGAWATSSDLVKKNPALVKAFVSAIHKSIAYAAGNEKAVREILPTYTAITADVAAKIRLPYFTSTLDKKAVQKLADLSLKFGAIPSAIDLNKLIVSP
jgi:NitT/TauT family transport system substrate-binding protein